MRRYCRKCKLLPIIIKPHYESPNILLVKYYNYQIHHSYSTQPRIDSIETTQKSQNDTYQPNFVLVRDEINKKQSENIGVLGWFFVILIPCSFYLIYESIYSFSGIYKMRDQTFFELVKDDPEINLALGPNIIAKRIISNRKIVDENGLQRFEIIFKIMGNNRCAKVYVEMIQSDDKKQWLTEYCIVNPISNDEKYVSNHDILEYDFNSNCFKYSDIYVPFKNKNVITYYIRKVPDYLKRNDVIKMIQSACNEWSLASENKITFKLIDNENNADIVVQWSEMESEGKTSYAHRLGTYKNGCIEFNSNKKWVVGLDEKMYAGKHSLYKTTLHELGHSLGLEHSCNPNTIMAPNANPTVKHLTDEDKQRVQSLWWMTKK